MGQNHGTLGAQSHRWYSWMVIPPVILGKCKGHLTHPHVHGAVKQLASLPGTSRET
jgi:hypothetical protein